MNMPAFQSLEQIQGVYGDKVAADIERNCAVRLALRPAGLSAAKKISEQLGTYTVTSRSMGTWGGGGSTSLSDQRRPPMLPQEVEMLPENDLIVFRRSMYAAYGKKVRHYEEKLAARTKILAPEMPTIRIDPAIARNSLRVIQAAGAEGEAAVPAMPPGPAVASVAPGMNRAKRNDVAINRLAVEAALAAPPSVRTKELFDHVISIEARAA